MLMDHTTWCRNEVDGLRHRTTAKNTAMDRATSGSVASLDVIQSVHLYVNLRSLVLVLTVHSGEIEKYVQDDMRLRVQMVHYLLRNGSASQLSLGYISPSSNIRRDISPASCACLFARISCAFSCILEIISLVRPCVGS